MRATFLLFSLLTACGDTPAPEATPPVTEATPPAAPAVETPAEVPAVETPAAGATVKFLEPADGATVTSPVKVVMGVEGLSVQAAGDLAAGTGHHHLIVDGGGVSLGDVVPKDATHIHFGDGSTEKMMDLTPGQHTLTLQFADGLHRSYGPQMSTTITINVAEAGAK